MSERVLTTVLFVDIDGAAERAAAMGDRPWAELLAQHYALARRTLTRYQGHEVDTSGDGLLATFDAPARGVRCAFAIREAIGPLGLEIRAGLHTGEVEQRGPKVVGRAVQIGARVAEQAAAGEVLITSTVKDVLAGAGMQIEHRGVFTLRGMFEARRLFAVLDAGTTDEEPPPDSLEQGTAAAQPLGQTGSAILEDRERGRQIFGRLVERSGKRAGTIHLLNQETTTIGRAWDNDVTLTNVQVSQHHARLEWDAKQWILFDRGSRNGTFVNEQRIATLRPLVSGDLVTIGDVKLEFLDDQGAVTLESPQTPTSDLWLDTERAQVWVGDRRVAVTDKEYLALALLYERGGALVRKQELEQRAWPGVKGKAGDETIEQLLSLLRQKIEENPDRPHFLITVPGLGYRLLTS